MFSWWSASAKIEYLITKWWKRFHNIFALIPQLGRNLRQIRRTCLNTENQTWSIMDRTDTHHTHTHTHTHTHQLWTFKLFHFTINTTSDTSWTQLLSIKRRHAPKRKEHFWHFPQRSSFLSFNYPKSNKSGKKHVKSWKVSWKRKWWKDIYIIFISPYISFA